ncbi:hypothetical protein KAX06_04840 [candidate division WOR-3 bacterium]|nr:hypothetical protein [candidate division WOR-3 bacterium]
MKKTLIPITFCLGVLAMSCKKEAAPIPTENPEPRWVVVGRVPHLPNSYAPGYKPPLENLRLIDANDWERGMDGVVFIFSETDVHPVIPYLWQGEDTVAYFYDGEYLWVNGKLRGLRENYYSSLEVQNPEDIVTMGVVTIPDLEEVRQYPNLTTIGLHSSTHMGKYPTLLILFNLMLVPRDIGIYIHYLDIADLDFLWFALIGNLKFLSAYSYDSTTSGLRYLALAQELRELNFYSLCITNRNLRDISRIPNLRRLSLESSGGTIDQEGLSNLARLTDLTELHLTSLRIDDTGLKYISQIPRLRVLDLNGSWVTDSSLRYLTNLKYLRYLRVNCSCLTDEGLRHLEGIQSLRMLNLSSSDRLTVSGLTFHGYLDQTCPSPDITPEGVVRLRKALTRCEIVW